MGRAARSAVTVGTKGCATPSPAPASAPLDGGAGAARKPACPERLGRAVLNAVPVPPEHPVTTSPGSAAAHRASPELHARHPVLPAPSGSAAPNAAAVRDPPRTATPSAVSASVHPAAMGLTASWSALWAGMAPAVSGRVSARMGRGVSAPRGRATARRDTLVLTAALCVPPAAMVQTVHSCVPAGRGPRATTSPGTACAHRGESVPLVSKAASRSSTGWAAFSLAPA